MLAETVAATRALLAAPSVNPPGDERAAAAVAARLLADRGVHDVTLVGERPERPNLLATVTAEAPGPTLLLCGHLDTKPVGDRDAWSHDPFAGEIEGGLLYGLGACDMKGGVAAIVVAAGRLLATGGLPRGRLLIALLADEEAGSTLGARWTAERGLLRADAAIIAEPAGIDADYDGLALGTRGSVPFRVEVAGAGGHSGLADRDGGTTATLAAARMIDRLDVALRVLPGVAVNVGATVEGGVYYGVRAAQCAFRGDVRIPPGLDPETVVELVRGVIEGVASDHPGVSATLRTDEIADAPFRGLEVAPDAPVAVACRAAAAAVLGRVPPDTIFPAATDSMFLQGLAGIPTMPAFGPGRLREAHRPDEHVSLASLAAAPLLLEAAVRAFLDGGPAPGP